jgi:alpha-amylase
VAKECEEWLAPKGFTAVQISPPNDHISGEAWWTRYQPVTYELISRSGDEAAFIDMVQRCWAVGVGIYADAVINHVAAGNGTSIAGSSYGGRSTPIFSPSDMHHFEGDTSGNCFVSNYSDAWNVQYCDLLGLPDLCTACSRVQTTVARFLNHMGEIGVAGFRFDAAQHQNADELSQLLGNVEPHLWKFGEVTEPTDSHDVHAVTPDMYTSFMDVTDFGYGSFVGQHMKVSQVAKLISDFSWSGMLSGDNAVVFIDNHDTQRGGAQLTFRNGTLYQLATVFMLAHPFGFPKVMSSYYFTSYDEGPPSIPVHGKGDVQCGDGKPWVCEHRWTPVANMVHWRRSAGGANISAVQLDPGNGSSSVAFCRGVSACVAFNQQALPWTLTFNVPLVDGHYCDVLQSDDPWSCPTVIVAGGVVVVEVPPASAVAFHVGRMRVVETV